ncbi:hypothetical protein EHT25_22385 [Larkinella rosea]|uniref:Uncharacterized protein n=1 Tax=Larkinella rosea TaxID=2025312 RepID=A0A3P1BJJ3_9BACT|nr:hypothetical protein EHT25_22385 [Larkinella rosea]
MHYLRKNFCVWPNYNILTFKYLPEHHKLIQP